MRVLPRFELFFLAFYTSLITLVGALVFFMTGRSETLVLSSLLLALYLAMALGKPLRRRRAARAELPGAWREFLQAQSPFYRGLEDKGRAGFERDVRLFLAETRVAGTGGAPVSWQSRLLIAAGAATMLHGRPDQEPPLRDGVTVYPGHAFDRNYRAGKGNIAGQAPAGGPLLVAEKSLREGFADGHDGYNVIIHELAHYFDHEARKGGETEWREAIAGQYRTHDFAASALDPYAAQNEAEFFACASEVFFEKPGQLAATHPNLFSLLVEFYGQDPRATMIKGTR